MRSAILELDINQMFSSRGNVAGDYDQKCEIIVLCISDMTDIDLAVEPEYAGEEMDVSSVHEST